MPWLSPKDDAETSGKSMVWARGDFAGQKSIFTGQRSETIPPHWIAGMIVEVVRIRDVSKVVPST